MLIIFLVLKVLVLKASSLFLSLRRPRLALGWVTTREDCELKSLTDFYIAIIVMTRISNESDQTDLHQM